MDTFIDVYFYGKKRKSVIKVEKAEKIFNIDYTGTTPLFEEINLELMNNSNTDSRRASSDFLKLYPDKYPLETGLKPLRLNFQVKESRETAIRYSCIYSKDIKLILIDPSGQMQEQLIQNKDGEIKLEYPVPGEWAIVLNSDDTEKIKFDISGEPGIYCYPHTRSPLAIEPEQAGLIYLYIEVPECIDSFMFSAIGNISKLEFRDLAGNEVLVEPVNTKPYLASAKNRHVHKITLKNKSDRLIKLKIYHEGNPLVVAVRERLRFLFARPVEKLPMAGIRLETVDENNMFLPCRINIFRGGEWWKAVYIETLGQNTPLPPGEYMIQAEHGYEHIPSIKYLKITPRAHDKLRFTVRKGLFLDANCYCGDIHVHSTVSDGTGTIEELYHAARCNGLDWLAFTDHANRSYKETCPEGMELVRKLSGANGVIGIPGVETDTHRPPNHYNALNIKAFVHPEREVINRENGFTEFIPKSVSEVFTEVMNQDSASQPVICVLNHPMHGACEGEKVLRECDFFKVFEVSTGNHNYIYKQRLLDIWFDLLNQGRHLSAVAGTDTHHFDFYPPGAERVYCYIKGKPTRKKIIEALRDGRSFCTWAPVLPGLKVNESVPGDTVVFDKKSIDLMVEINCKSLLPLERVDLVFNGEIFESISVEDRISTASSDWEYPLNASSVFDLNKNLRFTCESSGWMLALVYLKGHKGHYAVTNPIYIEEKE